MTFSVANLGMPTALVTLPLTGAWTVDLALSPVQDDVGAALTGRVRIDLNGLTLSGTVVRSEAIDGIIAARVVGGAGKMGTELPEKFYRGSSTLAKIVGDMLREAGETLAGASSTTLLANALGTWQRARETVGAALSRVLRLFGGSWRMTPAGEVLVVAAESWPVVAPAHTLVAGSDPTLGTYRVAWPDTTPSDVLPGVTFRGARIRYVIHELTAGSLRTEVRTQEPRQSLDRLRVLMAREDWYTRLWPGVVDRQNADGSVDVVVDGKWGETAVTLRHGLAGVTVLVAAGQQVLLGYEGADPKRPYAALWKASGTAKIGTLLLAQNAASLALLPPQWFAAGPTGDAAAAAALAVVLAAGNVGYTLPLTAGIVQVT